MNNVGVYGKLSLQTTDLNTGLVKTEEILNLITNYGLGRFFGAKEITERVANRIYIGYKEEPANIVDDVIPTDWRYMDIATYGIESTDNLGRTGIQTILNKFDAARTFGNSNTVEEETVNHAYLAHVGADGIPHALTSFKIGGPAGLPLRYTRVEISYSVVISYQDIVYADNTSGFKVDRAYTTPSQMLNLLQAENAFRPAGVTTEASENYAIPLTGTWDNVNNTFKQTYKVIVKNVSANTGQRYWFGPCMVGFVVPELGEYEVTMEIGRVDPNLVATAPTACNKYDTSRLRVLGPGFCKLNIRNVAAPYAILMSGYFGADGIAVINGYTSLFNKGRTYRFEAVAPNGTTAYADLTTPDESADPLIAFYKIGDSKFRAIGNRGDKVEVTVRRAMDYNSTELKTGAIGTCLTPSEDEPGYYYCDIDVDPSWLAHAVSEDVHYTNTDLAGNVYTDTTWRRFQRLVYVAGLPYSYYKSDQDLNINSGKGVSEPGNQEGNGIVVEMMDFKGEII